MYTLSDFILPIICAEFLNIVFVYKYPYLFATTIVHVSGWLKIEDFSNSPVAVLYVARLEIFSSGNPAKMSPRSYYVQNVSNRLG